MTYGADREGLAEMLAYVRSGDTVVVVKLDRLGRSLSGIIRTIETLAERGIVLRSLLESIDTSTSVGRMLVGIFGSLAEYERSLIVERSEVAREAVRSRGKQTDRPRSPGGCATPGSRSRRSGPRWVLAGSRSTGCCPRNRPAGVSS